jgi:hypothetical protein
MSIYQIVITLHLLLTVSQKNFPRFVHKFIHLLTNEQYLTINW